MSRLGNTIIALLLLLNFNDVFAGSKAKNSAKPAEVKTANKGSKVTAARPTVVIETNQGTFEAELYDKEAPESVKNFLTYVDEKYYDDTVFHRVIENFMIQGGGFTPDMKQKSTKAAIKNEASADLKNERGTLAMARTMEIDSATSQFFVNHVDNEFLNHKGKGPQTFGYAVFGKVTKGMDVVDKIAKVPTGNSGSHQNVPREPVIVKSIRKK